VRGGGSRNSARGSAGAPPGWCWDTVQVASQPLQHVIARELAAIQVAHILGLGRAGSPRMPVCDTSGDVELHDRYGITVIVIVFEFTTTCPGSSGSLSITWTKYFPGCDTSLIRLTLITSSADSFGLTIS
jgi:hypothetical protein